MKVHFLIVLVAVLGCSPATTPQLAVQDNNKFGDITDGLPDQTQIISIKDELGQLTAQGQVAVFEQKPTDIRVGLWKEFFRDGKVRNEGHYKIGSYLQCCPGGTCRQFYYYLTGAWQYFDPNGLLTFAVNFEPEILSISTLCEGGDKLVFGLIKSIPLTSQNRKLTTDEIYELQKITFADQILGTWTYTPLNGELHIEYSRK